MILQRHFLVLALVIGALLVCSGCTQPSGTVTQSTEAIPAVTASPVPSTVATLSSQDYVLLETTMGNITIALDPDMPITSGNFEKLVKSEYYNGIIFHRVIPGFMIQGGDPTGTGMGGPGYTIPDEFTSHNHNARGTVAMANAGPNTGGSQFFINLVNNNFLDTKHPVFGKVVEGMDIVDRISKTKTGSGDRPVEKVTILHAIVE